MAKFEKGNKKGRKFKKGEQQSEIGRKGGLASQKKRRENKALREVALEHLNEILSNGKTTQENLIDKARSLAFKDKARLKDVLDLLVFLRDTSGQKPVDKIAETDINGNDKITIVADFGENDNNDNSCDKVS